MVILWLLAVEVLGLAALPLTLAFLPGLKDRGYGLAKTLGILLITWLNWLLGVALGAANVAPLLWLLALGIGGVGWWALRRRGEDPRTLLHALRGTVLIQEGLFLAAFAALALVRAYHPDIFGTEKPMDLMYMTTSMEHSRFAPPDLWLSGTTVNYYYLGYLAMATVARMSLVSAPVAFNLALALIFALTLCGAYALGLTLTRSRGWALLAPAFVGLAGNLAGWLQVWGNLTSGVSAWAQVNGWCASRVIGGCTNYTTINEFPFFSFILGDLHPHVIALPFALLCLAIALNVAVAHEGGVRAFGPGPLAWPLLGLAALTLGSLYAINSWDLPTYLLMVMVALVVGPLVRGVPLGDALRGALAPAGALAALSVVLWAPFWVSYHSSARGLGVHPTATAVGEYLTVNGAFLAPLVILLVVCTGPALWRWARGPVADRQAEVSMPAAVASEVSEQQVVLAGNARPLLVVGALVLLLGLLHGSVAGLALLVLALVAYRLVGPAHEGDPRAAFAWTALGMAMILTITCEVVYLRDLFDGSSYYRMNTVFKFYYQIWILLAVAAAWAFAAAWRRASSARHGSAAGGGRLTARHLSWALLLGVVLLTTGTYTVLAVPSMGASQGAVPTLDGTAFLNAVSPSDAGAIAWLRDNAPRDAVVAEAVGGDYWGGAPVPRSGQVAVFSGLPTLIEAAASHEGLWHPNDPAIALHQQAMDAIYGPSAAAAQAALTQYHVQYVYVGGQEAALYANGDPRAPNLTKFGTVLHLRVVLRNGGVTIYEV